MSFPDFHRDRQVMAEYPDEMVHDIAERMLGMMRQKIPNVDADMVWIIESYERRRPKIHTLKVSEAMTVKETVS